MDFDGQLDHNSHKLSFLHPDYELEKVSMSP